MVVHNLFIYICKFNIVIPNRYAKFFFYWLRHLNPASGRFCIFYMVTGGNYQFWIHSDNVLNSSFYFFITIPISYCYKVILRESDIVILLAIITEYRYLI